MGAGHTHDGGHEAGRAADRRRLLLVLAVTGGVALVELVGAWLSGSLALLADAGHMFTDAAALVLALSASLLASRPATPRRTFGYHRAEIFAALVNALVLLGICGFLVVTGLRRLGRPTDVDAGQLLVFAGIGLVANVTSLAVLASRDRDNLNMRGAFLEVLSDTAGSVAAIVAGVVILSTGFLRADPIASLAIAALILPRSFALLRESVGVLLEAAPPGIEVDDVRGHLCGVDGVIDVHDLHAWQITSGLPALSAHVRVTDAALAERGVGPLLDELSACVAECFGIQHATFQLEPASHVAHERLGDSEHA
ncbi:MAG TPA: cation diffusion facilitator family transporter [Marmoricola sp.]|jgi:cobalt-zinc-cadmium efflux system protein|nr:cation diffusion facilitator family transporter [Marmoricola sp.]